MSALRYAIVVFAALVIAFVATNVIVSRWFSGARLDLTENRLYSLSRGTKETLAGLGEPVTLTFYYSREAAANDPDLRDFAGRVRELLETYRRQSRGRVRLVEIDPVHLTDAEDKASARGMRPIERAGQDPVFLGVAGSNSVDETADIAQLTPDQEPILEYELTRLIAQLQSPTAIKIALLTGLPWDAAAAKSPDADAAPYVLRELVRYADVVQLPADFTAVPDDASLLFIVAPPTLSEPQLRALDAFMMRRGRAFIALDPAPIESGDVVAPGASGIERLLAAWGVQVSGDVVLDGDNALPVPGEGGRLTPQPLIFAVPPDQVDQKDILMSGMARGLNFASAGAISWSPTPGVQVAELAHTSGATMRISAEQAMSRPAPESLLQEFAPASKRESLAVRLQGRLPSAFGGRSEGEGAVILLSDSDVLTDRLFVGGAGAVVADNPAFVFNAVDQLAGTTALLKLRSRAPGLRRLDKIDAIRNAAEARMAKTKAELEGELQTAEQRLRAMQNTGRGSGFFTGRLGSELTDEEKSEIDRFRAQELRLRTQIREIERASRNDVDRIKGWLLFLDVWLMPLLVVGGGLFWTWRRERRSLRLGASAPSVAGIEPRPVANASQDEAA